MEQLFLPHFPLARAPLPRAHWSVSSLARVAFLGVVVGFLLGCSISLSDGPAEPVRLTHDVFGPAVTLTQLFSDQETTVYRVSSSREAASAPNSRESAPVYLSALRSCSVIKGENLPTIARRLFVGLEQLRITSRDKAAAGILPLLTLSFDGVLDEQPIAIVALSTVDESCAFDIALWSTRRNTVDSSANADSPVRSFAAAVRAALQEDDGARLQELVR